MNRGVPPTAENALTGEFTPPGMTAHASANSAAEAATDNGVRCMTTSVAADAKPSTTGCRTGAERIRGRPVVSPGSAHRVSADRDDGAALAGRYRDGCALSGLLNGQAGAVRGCALGHRLPAALVDEVQVEGADLVDWVGRVQHRRADGLTDHCRRLVLGDLGRT